jgi:hypothetical protein
MLRTCQFWLAGYANYSVINKEYTARTVTHVAPDGSTTAVFSGVARKVNTSNEEWGLQQETSCWGDWPSSLHDEGAARGSLHLSRRSQGVDHRESIVVHSVETHTCANIVFRVD